MLREFDELTARRRLPKWWTRGTSRKFHGFLLAFRKSVKRDRNMAQREVRKAAAEAEERRASLILRAAGVVSGARQAVDARLDWFVEAKEREAAKEAAQVAEAALASEAEAAAKPKASKASKAGEGAGAATPEGMAAILDGLGGNPGQRLKREAMQEARDEALRYYLK